MTHDEETCSLQAIEFCRQFNRKMAAKQQEAGVRVEDIAIAAIASAIDLAQHHPGDTESAIAWVRSALDVAEASQPLTMETMQ